MYLLDSQVSAIEKLIKFKVGALFMEPGTGKTRVAYELVKSVSHMDYILWLTPFRTKISLRNELIKYGGLDCDIVGIETLSSSDRVFFKLHEKLNKNQSSFVVCDESLKIKNWEAKRTKRILQLGKLSLYRLVLNGTPLSRNLLDVWAQLEFLSPKILNMSLAQYKNTFCEYVSITKSIGHRRYTKEYIARYHNVEYLYSLIKHYVYEVALRLDKRQSWETIEFAIDSDFKEEYQRLKEKYLDNEYMLFRNNNIFLEMTQKMQNLYCCSGEKFEKLKKIIETHGADNIIVFCKYIRSRLKLKELFPKLKVLSFGMHAFGFNLQNYNTTVFFDKTWDYAQRLQAELRTYRIGQKRDCIYYDLTGDVGLETLIDFNIKKKTDLLDFFKKTAIKDIKKAL